MKAIFYSHYGSPEVLQLKEIKKPVPAENEVLIRVHAASLNSWDWDLLSGQPKIFRLISGIFRPRWNILGADVAGVIERVGSKVSRLKPGQAVFGDLSAGKWGALAEYVCAAGNALREIPEGMSFKEAAAIPQAGTLAFQGILDKCSLQPGQKVLINGAGGGVGTFALQLAKSMGAEVTVVDREEKFERLRSLGADRFIDYTCEDFVMAGEKYDLILDVIAHRSMLDYIKVMNPAGIYAIVGGTPGRIFQSLYVGIWLGWTSQKKMQMVVHQPNKYLEEIVNHWKAGKVRPIIDSWYPLDQASEAFRKLGDGRVQGKIVIAVREDMDHAG